MPDGKWIAGLTPEMPIAEAAKLTLTARFAVVEHFLPLAAEKPHEDIEYVHQLRVGTRRATAALRVFASAMPRKSRKEVKAALQTIRRAAGDARDWDVFATALPTAKAFSTAAAKPALDLLIGYAMGQRVTVQPRLVNVATEAGALFREQCENLLDRVRVPEAEDTPANFGQLAGRQLGELLAQFTTSVEANPKEAEALHALRIAGKRLRYAIEIFADCFPPGLKESIYPSVERLQEILGDVQDANVGTERLAAIRGALEAVLPEQFARVKRGFDAFAKSLRAKVPAGSKAFTAWRKEWLASMKALKLEVLATTITA